MNRPLLWVAGSYAVGIALAARFPIPIPILLILATLALVLSIVSYRRGWQRAVSSSLLLGICLAGGLCYSARRPVVTDDALSRELRGRYRETVSVKGTVVETSLYHDGIGWISFVIDAHRIGKEPASRPISGKAQVHWQSPDIDLRLGDVVVCTAQATPFPGHLNPGLTHYRDILQRKGICSTLSVYHWGSVEKVGSRKPPLNVLLVERARRKMHDTFRRTLPEKHADFLSAVWLGERSMLRGDVKQTFVESGIYHLTVVSGLHVFIVYSMVTIILGISAPVRKRRIIVAIAFIVFYALISAARPPVVRAAIMAVTILAAGLFRREPDRLSTLCLAGFLMLLWDPALLFSASFQLSFLAATAIILFAPMVEEFFLQLIARWKKRRLTVLTPAHASFLLMSSVRRFPLAVLRSFSHILALTLFMVPVTAQFFNLFAPIALAANMVVIPLIGPMLGLTALASLSGFFSVPVARLFNATNRFLIEFIFRLADFFSSVPGGHFRVRAPSTISLICFYAAMVLILFHRHIRLRKPALAAVVACLFVIGIGAYAFVIVSPELEVVFLDVGQGDCIFVQLPDDGALLIDAGPSYGRRDTGEHIIVPFLRQRGVRRLEAVLLTHPEDDHMGGLPYVLEHYPVLRILTNGERSQKETYEQLVEIAEKRNIPIEPLARGSRIVAGDKVTIRTLHPPRRPEARGYMDVNERSLVLQLKYGTIDFLFTGDISGNIERELCENYDDIESEVLKVPHHGSRGSSSTEFLAAVKPQVAVVQVGLRNSHGHPSPEALERHRAANCRVFRTDLDGGVTITSDGKKFWYRTEADIHRQELDADRSLLEMWQAM